MLLGFPVLGVFGVVYSVSNVCYLFAAKTPIFKAAY